MDTKQLKTFVVLAKEKNYIKASEILNYAPSTLAKHIHALEAEFSTDERWRNLFAVCERNVENV